jgi:peptidoglycan/LPS O-acetylase OafA/YrhL
VWEGFFVVSACMLTHAYSDLNRSGLRRFYWRRLVSVGVPYLCWTVIYFLFFMPTTHYHSVTSALQNLAAMAYTGYFQLYFLLVIMQFYLVGGCVVACHLEQVDAWVRGHARLILTLTAVAALAAEGIYFLAQHGVTTVLGSGSEPFQPSVIPFNVCAITCGYLAGVALVRPGRSRLTRAVVRSGSVNAYGVYLSHLLVLTTLVWLGWRNVDSVIPWPLFCLLTVGIIVAVCVPLTELLARTPLAVPLAGRKRVPWRHRASSPREPVRQLAMAVHDGI